MQDSVAILSGSPKYIWNEYSAIHEIKWLSGTFLFTQCEGDLSKEKGKTYKRMWNVSKRTSNMHFPFWKKSSKYVCKIEGHKLKWSLSIIYLCTEPLKSSSSHNLKMSRDQYNTTIRLQSDVRKHMLCLSYTFLNNHAQLSFVPGVTQAYNKSSSKLKPLVPGSFQEVVNLLQPSQ